MSLFKSYFSKNNTVIRDSKVNTARNPAVLLTYGNTFSKYIFDIDLEPLKDKVASGDVILNSDTKHYIHMTNCIFGDEDLLGETHDTQRASSFDLIVFKVKQEWDEGVGYDAFKHLHVVHKENKLYLTEASNWYNATTLSGWSETGIYTTNVTGGTTAEIVTTQHFDRGNENLHVDVTSYINQALTGTTYGLGLAFAPIYETINDGEYDKSVSFFSKYTQTFFEPYIETVYDDHISDDRNDFSIGIPQQLLIYVTFKGERTDLDTTPTVDLLDASKDPINGYTGLTASKISKGIYGVTVTLTGATICDSKLYFYDKWKGLVLNGQTIPAVTQKFVLNKVSDLTSFTNEKNKQYVPFLYGIKRGEMIKRGDVRKVVVEVKEVITGTKKLMNDVYYRLYVTEGKTEIDVASWTRVNKMSNENNFYFDTSFLLPREYFIDVKVEDGGEVTTLKNVINFQIVSEK